MPPRIPLLAAALLIAMPSVRAQDTQSFDAVAAGRFARLALDCVHREYPNKISHVLQEDADARPPRDLTPCFYGCYDWHSAVHAHWLLARFARTWSEAPLAKEARAALAATLDARKVAGEVRYLQGKGRTTFERPYGLAWLLQVAAELAEWDDPQARAWREALKPLEQEAARRLAAWLPKLSHPIRTGEHEQTAFSMGLFLDWARTTGARDMEKLIVERGRAYYLADRGANLAFEPGGQDFLSPALSEADFMRRVLEPPAFAAWLGAFLPGLPLDGGTAWLRPAVVTDRKDGKLGHLDGLNLSRAWMLEGIASGLPAGDPRLAALNAAAAEHRREGLLAVTGEHYMGGHWLGSFALYLVTRRGLRR